MIAVARCISIIMILIGDAQLDAQTPPQSPESVSRQFHEAMIRKDWTAAVQLVDPAELARNKAMFKPVFDRDTTRYLMKRILNDDSGRRFDELSDVEFNSRLFGFVTQVRAESSGTPRFLGVDVMAVAIPEPDHAFVVYQWRLPPGERPIRGRNVTELHRRNGKWMLDMLGDFTDFKELLERQ
jgi:hypothetical protein